MYAVIRINPAETVRQLGDSVALDAARQMQTKPTVRPQEGDFNRYECGRAQEGQEWHCGDFPHGWVQHPVSSSAYIINAGPELVDTNEASGTRDLARPTRLAKTFVSTRALGVHTVPARPRLNSKHPFPEHGPCVPNTCRCEWAGRNVMPKNLSHPGWYYLTHRVATPTPESVAQGPYRWDVPRGGGATRERAEHGHPREEHDAKAGVGHPRSRSLYASASIERAGRIRLRRSLSGRPARATSWSSPGWAPPPRHAVLGNTPLTFRALPTHVLQTTHPSHVTVQCAHQSSPGRNSSTQATHPAKVFRGDARIRPTSSAGSCAGPYSVAVEYVDEWLVSLCVLTDSRSPRSLHPHTPTVYRCTTTEGAGVRGQAVAIGTRVPCRWTSRCLTQLARTPWPHFQQEWSAAAHGLRGLIRHDQQLNVLLIAQDRWWYPAADHKDLLLARPSAGRRTSSSTHSVKPSSSTPSARAFTPATYYAIMLDVEQHLRTRPSSSLKRSHLDRPVRELRAFKGACVLASPVFNWLFEILRHDGEYPLSANGTYLVIPTIEDMDFHPKVDGDQAHETVSIKEREFYPYTIGFVSPHLPHAEDVVSGCTGVAQMCVPIWPDDPAAASIDRGDASSGGSSAALEFVLTEPNPFPFRGCFHWPLGARVLVRPHAGGWSLSPKAIKLPEESRLDLFECWAAGLGADGDAKVQNPWGLFLCADGSHGFDSGSRGSVDGIGAPKEGQNASNGDRLSPLEFYLIAEEQRAHCEPASSSEEASSKAAEDPVLIPVVHLHYELVDHLTSAGIPDPRDMLAELEHLKSIFDDSHARMSGERSPDYGKTLDQEDTDEYSFVQSCSEEGIIKPTKKRSLRRVFNSAVKRLRHSSPEST
ncbi:uncharacterized protein BXZ73DRAFT_76874 [Epithele typhae]|uniref:uncharacterized protein n=1 Tax=Epithele typhae TaxID=378194 RepID=UPI002007DC0C|nr:uncharacterized protein BXZ73DRAFT_76874 [Epithele typhae]KAH9935175.1 hypothetical protein BXZ73DRAFT_76874 [Epithele typhae]